MKNNKKEIILLSVLSIVGITTLLLNIFIFNDKYVYSLLLCLLLIIGIIIVKLITPLKLNVKTITTIATMSAFSCILYIFVKFPLPIFPSFLDIQISELPAVFTSFIYGPISGIIVIFIRFLVKLPLSTTSFVGELGDLILGIIFIIPMSLYYKKHHNLKGAIIGYLISTGVAIVGAISINTLILVPFYIDMFFKGNTQAFISLCEMIPGINDENYMLYYNLAAVLPFNLLRYGLVALILFPTYKKVHNLIKAA